MIARTIKQTKTQQHENLLSDYLFIVHENDPGAYKAIQALKRHKDPQTIAAVNVLAIALGQTIEHLSISIQLNKDIAAHTGVDPIEFLERRRQ